jgi:predicted DNA-binding protein with PD1-like motif
MKLIRKISVIFLLVTSTIALASNENTQKSSAVNKSSCKKLVNTTQPFILVLNNGDDLIESITQCAKDAELVGATVAGLGQLHNPVLAYFSSDPNAKPTLTNFSGFYELASLNGDITNNSGKYYTHLHATLADKQFHGLAGHVNGAKVGQTAEIIITPLSAPLERTVNSKTGFGPIVS